MKYLFLFLSVFVLWLSGCSLTSNKTPATPTISYTGYIYPNKEFIVYPELKNKQTYNQSEWFIVPLTGKFSQNIQIWQNISIKNATLTYSWLFSLSLPYTFDEWEYSTWLQIESLLLFSKKNSISIYINNGSFSTERGDEKTKCEDTIWEFISSTSKTINGKTLYINTIRYPESSFPSKDICFIHDGLTYTISSSDNNFITKIIPSFVFFPQKTPQKQSEHTWQYALIPQTTWIYSNMIVSWNTFVYKNLFSIAIPERLQFWQIALPSMYTVDLYLIDKLFNGFQMDDISFLHVIATPISSRKEPTELQTCLALQNNYEPNRSDIHTGKHTTYYMYGSYDVFWYLWKQWNICFFDDRFVYNISVRLSTIPDVLNIINSFTFLD